MTAESLAAIEDDGWSSKPLGDVANGRKGKTPKLASSRRTSVPYLDLATIEGAAPTKFAAAATATPVRAGDVVVVWDGARCGMPAIAPIDGALGSTLTHIESDDLDSRFLYYFLLSQWRVVNVSPRGTGLPHVDPDLFWTLEVPIPPMGEQIRIAERVGALRERVELLGGRLRSADDTVGVFRRAVLRSAVTGGLTATWRSGDGVVTEPPSLDELLRRRAERQVPRSSKELGVSSLEDLPELPPGWRWIPLPLLGEFGRGKSRHRPRNDPQLYDGPYPFIQTGDITRSNGRVTEYRQTYNDAGLEQSKKWPADTVVITITGANTARSAVLTFEACFPDSIVGLVPDPDVCTAEYVEYFIRTAQADLLQFAPATTQPNINLEILSEVVVPVPPLEEQVAVVEAVGRGIQLASDVELRVARASALADRLTDSAVLSALRGEAHV